MAASAEVLADIQARRRPVADALKDWGLAHRFAGSGDRAAIGNLVYDVLRRRRSLAHRMGSEAPVDLVAAACLEGFALTPDALGEALADDRFAPELPSAHRLATFLADDLADAPAPVRADLPDWLAPSFARSLGEDWVAQAAALGGRPPLDLRANTLKTDRETVARALAPVGARLTDLSPVGLRIAPIEGAGRHPNVTVEAGFQKGLFEVQDEGSQLVSHLSLAQAGEQVLDLCAGGGGKTLALSAMMQNAGQVHATDSDRQRLAPIHDRLKRAETRNVQVHDPRDDLSALEGRMDLVLVDAPCTGTGTWRRRPDAKWRLGERQLDKRRGEQDLVLNQAAAFVKPGGRLVYVTCSLLAEENGERIDAFLKAQGDSFAASDARENWRASLPDTPERFLTVPVAGGHAIALTPLTSGTDGFFFCELRRK